VSKLVIFRGDAVEKEVHLAGNTVRIGRDARNDIVLDDKSVSRFHAEVRADAGTFFIVDLKSRNGVWVNGQQIKGRAALALGAPVTLGAYELALEDDVSTGAFDDEPPVSSQHTVVSAASADQGDRPGRSATQRWSTQPPAAAAKRSAVFWSGLVLTTLLLCGITYVIIRYIIRTPATVAVVAPPDAPAPPTAPPEDPKKEATDRHLADARTAIESQDYPAALNFVLLALESDPDNQQALELRRQADEGVAAAAAAAAAATKAAAATRVETKVPDVVETPGIPRRAGEAPADYLARATRIRANIQEGHRDLDKQDFANAISRFEAVDRDQKNYQGVESLITEAAARQRKAVEEAIDNGQKNEQAGKLADAVRWYQQALRFDSTSTTAQNKIAALSDRLTKEGLDAFSRAEVFRKRNDFKKAIEFYKRAADLLPSGHEKSGEAQQWLEKLK
jgi:tetratricopeptide (TPR) repeat protein